MKIKPNSDVVKIFLDESENARLDHPDLKELYGDTFEFINDHVTDTQGYMRFLNSGKKVIISFRGTQQRKDFLTNFNGFHTSHELVIPYDNDESEIKCHRGFVGAYHAVRAQIHRYLNKYQPEEVFVCGHSLGGALATLCAVDVQFNRLALMVKCFPSGSPKVGNAAFVKSYNKRVPFTIRTVMRRDIVPKLPPKWLEKLFKQKSYHVGIKNSIGPSYWFYGIVQWFRRKDKKGLLAQNLINHSIDLYKNFA